MRFALVLLLLAGCPDDDESTPDEETYDFFAGEGVDWHWGEPTCVVYMRDVYGPAKAWWMNGAQVVRSGALSGVDTIDDFRRGYYRFTGRLAIEYAEGTGASVKRYFYDETQQQRLVEIVSSVPYSMRAVHTALTYDAAGRLATRVTNRVGQDPLFETWTYNASGWLESFSMESNGRPVRGFSTMRNGMWGPPLEVRYWQDNRVTIYRYEYGPTGVVTSAHTFEEGSPSTARDLAFEYDDKRRVIARTLLPTAQDEAGQRTELEYSDMLVLERRALTAAGFLNAKTTYERGTRGDMRVVTDTNLDGEPDQVVDLRDECNAYQYVPELAAVFAPHLDVDGLPPFRPDPFTL